MELNEFITKALVEIANGVKNANNELQNHSFEIEAFGREKVTGFISFDIAVKTTEENGKSGKAGIQVMNLGVGGEIKKDSTNEQANKIKFFVLPVKNIG